MKLSDKELKDFLEEKTFQYNSPSFIESDPVSIPHRFSKKEDIEISAFLSAVIAWGNRKAIVASAARIMELMDNSPHEFILHHTASDLKRFKKFVHRTFNGGDAIYFIRSLKNIYKNHGGMECIFQSHFSHSHTDLSPVLSGFKATFYELPKSRTQKHLPDPLKNSSSKRMNMFLRWMVRNDKKGVDFGLWKFVSPSQLSIPLDVHTGNVARKLGLLKRKQSDWKAVTELTARLQKFDPNDPVKYDFALFGLGVFEKFSS
jgi:uncharacterized protein (TIGR02757 family)